MKLNVGTIQSDNIGFDSIADIAEKTRNLWFESVELDFSYCGFFEANMTAPLYAVIAQLREGLNDVSIAKVPSGVSTILRKNRFLSVFNQPDLVDTNQTTLPFKIFKLNVSDQFFPQKHRMDFTIADAGVGIRENVRKYTGKEKLNSCKAIEWAMTEGNTTKTGNHPGGLGLKLIKDFIQMNKGKLQIVSRFGYYEFSATGGSIKKMAHDFPGTCINIEINTEDTSNYCLKSELTSEDIF